MTDLASKLLLFVKDFTGRGGDLYYWLDGDQLAQTGPAEVVEYAGVVICHDFWMIRDTFFDSAKSLPGRIVDLDEFRIAISGNPEDRVTRERLDIISELGRRGASSEICAAYRNIFNRAADFDTAIVYEAAKALEKFYFDLCVEASSEGELERFFSVEVPAYHVLQKAMAAGIPINSVGLSEKRKEAEHDYFLCLKNYSAKHDMPLETPRKSDIEARLYEAGFELGGVSTEYILEFVPHEHDFGLDTIALQEFDAAKQILSSLSLSSGCTTPIVDTFGSRTSRIQLRSPSLQNMPKKYRTIIEARAGLQLCYVDFDQYEVGIMAALSEDPELMELYGSGDMYDLFASTHLGLENNRRAAKQLFLSYAYGMSRKALIDAAVSLGASREKSKSAFRQFARYEEWKKSIWETFRSEGRIATVEGNHYARNEKGQLTRKEQRSAVSQVVQGTASLIFKKALLEVSKLEDVTILLPMHDALLFEHGLPETPPKVVAAFESMMTTQLEGRVKGKASISPFTQA